MQHRPARESKYKKLKPTKECVESHIRRKVRYSAFYPFIILVYGAASSFLI